MLQLGISACRSGCLAVEQTLSMCSAKLTSQLTVQIDDVAKGLFLLRSAYTPTVAEESDTRSSTPSASILGVPNEAVR